MTKHHYSGIPQLKLFFGNKNTAFIPAEYKQPDNAPLLLKAPFSIINQQLKLSQLWTLHQVHGTQGLTIATTMPLLAPFQECGDFLITQRKNIGLAIATADCLPIILHDPTNHAIGIAHAGWRGSVANIAPIMLQKMQITFGTNPSDVKALLGPSARSCCYIVDTACAEHIPLHYQDSVLRQCGHNQWEFDLPHLNVLQLLDSGIPIQNISMQYNS